jgi:hypothetical protein
MRAEKEKFEKAITEFIAGDIENLLSAARDNDTDFLGFRTRFYRVRNREYSAYMQEKSPNDFLRDLRIDIKTNLEINL